MTQEAQQNSIFNLKRSKNQLSSTNEKVSDFYFREVQSLRNVQDGDGFPVKSRFGDGIISVRWTLDNRTWWLPSRSFIKMRIKINRLPDVNISEDGNPLEKFDNIAPNWGLAANLFQKMQFKMNDTTVDSIDENLIEIDALQNRLKSGGRWMEELGQNLNMWDHDFETRQNTIIQQGNKVKSWNNCQANMKVFKVTVSGLTNPADTTVGNSTDTLGFIIPGVGGTTVAVLGQDNLMTFGGNRARGQIFAGEFCPGDCIMIKYTGFLVYKMWMVLKHVDDTLLQVMTPGCDSVDQAAAEIEEFIVFRYPAVQQTNISTIQNMNDFAGAGNDRYDVISTSINDTGDISQWVLKGNTMTFWSLGGKPGDIIYTHFADIPDGDQHLDNTGINDGEILFNMSSGHGEQYHQNNDGIALSSSGDANSQNGRIGAAINDGFFPVAALRWTHGEWTDGEAIGFSFNAYRIFPWRIGDAAANYQMLVRVDITAPSIMPNFDIKEHFNIGDWIIYANEAIGGAAFRQLKMALVVDYLPATDSLYNNAIITTNNFQPDANLAIANLPATLNFVWGRFRPGGPKLKIQKRLAKEFDICWHPKCLGIFNIDHALPGGTKFELELNPFSNSFYQTRGVQSMGGPKVHDLDYQFQVKELKFYICQMQGPIVESDQYYIDLNETRCHKITLLTSNQTQSSIDVVSSSYALTLAFQDTAAGAQTNKPGGFFKLPNEDELKLRRYSIRFAGRSLPNPDADILVNTQIHQINDQYIRNHLYSGSYYQLTQETLEDWKARGIFLHHPFYRTALNRETRVYIITSFNNNNPEDTANPGVLSTFGDNTRMLLFEHYKRVVIIKMENGRVFSVRSSNT